MYEIFNYVKKTVEKGDCLYRRQAFILYIICEILHVYVQWNRKYYVQIPTYIMQTNKYDKKTCVDVNK